MKRRAWMMSLALISAGLGLTTASYGGMSGARLATQGEWPPMAVVVNGGSEGGISLIDPVTDTALGPFLGGRLGPSDGLLDVVVTPDGRTAIVSNFTNRTLVFIDVEARPPVRLGPRVRLLIEPEDMALSPDGQFVLVTSGLGMEETAMDVVSVDVAGRRIVDQLKLTGDKQAQAVDVAPDGETVLVTDFENAQIHVLQLNPDGTLAETDTSIASDGQPVNVVISPDGKTAIAANFSTSDGSFAASTVTILRINGPLDVVKTGTVNNLFGNQQGAAFTPDGVKAWVLSIAPRPDRLSLLNVDGPGMVTNGKQFVPLLSDVISGLLGVDVIAVAPDGTKAYVGNPSVDGALASQVAVVDLTGRRPHVRGRISMPMPLAIAFPRAGGR
ncbi:MAG: YncE family protein [Acidobacteria bacterium]|nr:MAG: YncE family protein [Acidobacteriota bacterium]